MSDFTVYKPRNGQILKNGRVMSASDLAVELAQLQATNARLVAERETFALEQQAKGVDDARHLYSINTFEGRRCWSSALASYAETLRKQAKEKGW